MSGKTTLPAIFGLSYGVVADVNPPPNPLQLFAGSIQSLPPLMLQLTSSPSPLHRLTVYQLLLSSPDLLFTFSSPQITAAHIAQVLVGGMHDSVNEIKLASIKATAAVLIMSEGLNKKSRNEVGPGLIGEAVQVLQSLPADMFPSAAVALNPLVMTHPVMFGPQFPVLLPMLESMCLPPNELHGSLPSFLQPGSFATVPIAPLSVGLDSNQSNPDYETIDFERYSAAQELLLTLLEYGKKSAVKKYLHKPGGLEMIPVFLSRMLIGIGSADGSGKEQEELQDWLEQEDLDEDDENYPVIPEEGLDRFAALFPGPDVCQTLFQYVQQLVQCPDWRARHTGLMAIAAVGENVQETMASQIPQVIDLIVPLGSDPHPRVRYAVCHSLGQLATDFEDQIQEPSVLEKVLRVEIELLSAPESRVAAHAAASIVNFVDGSDGSSIAPYLDQMVTKLLELLNNRPIFVNEQALTTIASIAITAEAHFARFYSTIMPLLLGLLRTPASKEHRMLKARGMECAGLVGMAVGKDVFAGDAMELANLLAQIQGSITDDDDPQSSYLTTTWAKIATALRTDFQPFMTHVMPSLLSKAALKPELMRVDPDDPNNISDSAGWEILELEDDSQIGIKTSALEDKATSFEMMAVYVVEVGPEAFAPYLEQALTLCLDALTFFFDERVREAAATMIPPMLQIAKSVGNASVAGDIFTKLIEAFVRENDMAYLALLYSKFSECLKIMDAPLPNELRTAFDSATQFQLTTMAETRQSRQNEQGGWDHMEREAESELEEAEDMALDEIGKVLYQVDGNHPLLAMAGSVRELGLGDHTWQDEEDDE